MNQEEPHSLEKKHIPLKCNGVLKDVPALHQSWITTDRLFTTYIQHPNPKNAEFVLGAKETWIQVIQSIQNDIQWLLSLPHHKFWSQMVYHKPTHQMIVSFLQEAPPFYLFHLFPDDKEMLSAFKATEKLVFLIIVRLTTQQESYTDFISRKYLGELLYENYLITIPILLDICVLFGQNNKTNVARLVKNVFKLQPKYVYDLEMLIPHLIGVLVMIEETFERNEGVIKLPTRELTPNQLRDLALHLYDTVATVQIFSDIYPNTCDVFHTHSFEVKVSNFYSTTIPIMYEKVNEIQDKNTRNELKEILDNCRIELLTIYHNLLSSLVHNAIENHDLSHTHTIIDEYMTILSEALSDDVFLNDYNSLYDVEQEIDVLKQIYPQVDRVKLDFIQSGIKSCLQPPKEKKVSKIKTMSLVDQVRDILPDLSDEFIQDCLIYYDMSSEDVISAVLEDNLPPQLKDQFEKNMVESYPDENNYEASYDPSSYDPGYRKQYNQETFNDVFNDKSEIVEMKDKYSQLATVDNSYLYDDEYDDTFEGVDVSVPEDDVIEKYRRPFVVPRVLAKNNHQSEEESEEEEARPQIDTYKNFVQNPEEQRAKYEERRRVPQREQKDVVGKPKGQGQDKSVTVNRNRKNEHKSSQGNHNRRNMARRKQNQGMIH